MKQLLHDGTPVDCYWNLHKHCYSVRARSGPNKGRIIAHATEVNLINVTLVVNKAGKQRVRTERRKNVHAFLRGTWGEAPIQHNGITYNPYIHDTFVQRDNGQPVLAADAVHGVICNGKPALYI